DGLLEAALALRVDVGLREAERLDQEFVVHRAGPGRRVEDPGEEPSDALAGRAAFALRLLDGGHHEVVALSDELAHETVRAAKVIEEGLDSDVGGLANIGDLGRRNPPLAEQLGCRGKNPLARLEPTAIAAGRGS